MPKLVFLGTGTSCGVPLIGCKCEVCTSHDQRDNRLRTSALYRADDGRNILIDCGPDFRQQMLRYGEMSAGRSARGKENRGEKGLSSLEPIDAVLLTHEHYDHVGGLDDLRPFTYLKDVDVYASPLCADHLKMRMPYCFAENKYPGVPNICLHAVKKGDVISVGKTSVWAIEVMHGHMPILAYRFGNMAYITDMSQISDEEKLKLKGLKVLVVNALRHKSHHSHQSLSEALKLIEELRPERAYLVHMSHEIGLHTRVEGLLPQNVHMAYDGLEISW